MRMEEFNSLSMLILEQNIFLSSFKLMIDLH